MKCTNKIKLLSYICMTVLVTGSFTGCGFTGYEIPYNADSQISSFNVIAKPKPGLAATFASNLCVVTEEITDDENVDMTLSESAALFDVNNNQVLYSKNAHERLYPASLTKVMTAIVALKYGTPDQVLTASEAVNITESGAQLCGLVKGDTMTLDQALHVLLIYSANDAANLIAENIGGSVDQFVAMMNEEARALGATNTNFVNAHGLSDENHYTTVYDLYLMFNEAIQNELFREIINMATYQTTYYDKNGAAKQLDYRNTNLFLRGDFQAPDNITVIGGKTGTTNAAGHCLILLTRDTNGAPYISVILKSESKDGLYAGMIDLLDEIRK